MAAWHEDIRSEAAKLIRRYEAYARQLAEEQRRRERRSIVPVPPLRLLRPEYWRAADGFDPYLVRARCERIGYSIARSVRAYRYRPFNAIVHRVPKVGGGLRDVSVFQVADNAVSRKIFVSLMKKNRARLSSRAYAYRDDISVHDAIQFLSAELRGQARIFVAEYDFSKYFDNISHEHIWRTIQDRQFLITEVERSVIEQFLSAPAMQVDTYVPTGGDARVRGVPQGTSISLFLANIAAWDLDRALERLGVSFVRYADDTLIWGADYSQICRAVETLHVMSERIGAPLNHQKSGGVRLMTLSGSPSELKSTECVEYLGHSIGLLRLSIKDRMVEKLKARVNNLIYFNLIRGPLRGVQSPNGILHDYITLVWQLRRYLYGDINERSLRRAGWRGIAPRRFRGFMSFFPLVDDEEQLHALDRWIRCQILLALHRRAALLTAQGVGPLPEVYRMSSRDLANYISNDPAVGDLRLPSVHRIAQVIRRAAHRYGANRIARRPQYNY
jgi:hypothetical protein